jgi:hypothetical protein
VALALTLFSTTSLKMTWLSRTLKNLLSSVALWRFHQCWLLILPHISHTSLLVLGSHSEISVLSTILLGKWWSLLLTTLSKFIWKKDLWLLTRTTLLKLLTQLLQH